MSVSRQRVFYDIKHYLNLDNFVPPKTKYGLRRVNLAYVVVNLVIFAVIAGFLFFYLYSQALIVEAESSPSKTAPVLSGLFFSSLGGAALALPLIMLIVWILRRVFVQPVFIYVNMFLHGAGFSVLASLVISGFTVETYDGLIEFTQSNPLSFFATVHAPVFEELFKGIGLLFLFMALPSFIRTPHDGAVYGMLIGFGFAFTENIQYFIQYGNTSEGFVFLLFMRVVASLFTHAIFTAATGLLLGYFWSKYGTVWKALLGWGAGLIVAISLHALWNGASSIGLFLIMYVLLFLPLFIASVSMLRKTAERYDHKYLPVLQQYSDAGWFSPNFYEGMFPKAERKKKIRFMRYAEKKKFRFLASSLAELVHIRQSIESSVQPEKFRRRESEILTGLFLHQKANMDK